MPRSTLSVFLTIVLVRTACAAADMPEYSTNNAMTGAVLVFIMAFIFVPWVCLLISVRVAAAAAGVLTVIATAWFLIGEFYYEPGDTVRLDLLLIPPALLLAWWRFIRLTVRALSQSSNQKEVGADNPTPLKVLGMPPLISLAVLKFGRLVLLAVLVCLVIVVVLTMGG